MPNECPYCGRTMYLLQSYRQWTFVCPGRFDGLHPQFTVTTSDNSGPVIDRRTGREL